MTLRNLAAGGMMLAATALAACGDGSSSDGATGTVRSLASVCRPPSPSQAYHLEDAFPGVTFDRPTSIINVSGDLFYLTEQSGYLRRITRSGDHFTSTVSLDISQGLFSTGEMGLLGAAVSPDFATSGEVWVTFTRHATQARSSIGQTVLARFTSKDGGLTFDTSTEEDLITLERDVPNHNGGRLRFGPDRMLYMSVGDDSWGDPKNRAQNPNELYGKVLRLDVLGGHPYRIPQDNPYAKGGGRGEVWALGFRNPWTFSFDKTGNIWLGDVGNNAWEEVDVVTRGGNYGWPIREGTHCLRTPPCDVPGATEPIWEYAHVDGFAVTGGFVYYGSKMPALTGKYVFSDFMTGRVWSLDPNAPTSAKVLFDSGLFVSGFGEDAEGELLLIDFAGHIVRMVASAAVPDPGQVSLRSLGCFEGDGIEPAGGFLPYEVSDPLWSDGLEKRRWVSVPDGTKVHVRQDGSWDPPPGGMFLKEFASGGRRIETRMLTHDPVSGWLGYTFKWNDAQTDAVLLADQVDVPLADGSTWTIPSPAQCLTCHSANADHILGFTAGNINHDIRLEDGTTVNQLARFESFAALDAPVDPAAAPRFPDPQGVAGTVEDRARAYLDVNCSTCHRPAVGASYGLDLRGTTPTAMMNVVCTDPSLDDLGIPEALLVAPGDPDRSVLYQRMATTDENRMPRIGSHKVDPGGLAAVRAWILSLSTCPSPSDPGP